MTRLGFVTGLVEEAGVLRRAGLADPPNLDPIAVGGVATAAARAADDLIAQGAGLLISFGVCGGLSPALACGDLVLSARIGVADGDDLDSTLPDAAVQRLARRVSDAGIRTHVGKSLGSDTAVLSTAEKTRLMGETGALCVDMESHAVARSAGRSDTPFLIVRAVADPAHRAIPALAMAGLAPDGTTRVWPVVRKLIVQPTALPALLRLARDTGQAIRTLRRVAGLQDDRGVPVLGAALLQ